MQCHEVHQDSVKLGSMGLISLTYSGSVLWSIILESVSDLDLSDQKY